MNALSPRSGAALQTIEIAQGQNSQDGRSERRQALEEAEIAILRQNPAG
jgi:hypothetical protein